MSIQTNAGTAKRIIAADAKTDLVDALADLLHVHDGDGVQVLDDAVNAMRTAHEHYRAEKAGEDGVLVEVIR